jgi:hypothetical protein
MHINQLYDDGNYKFKTLIEMIRNIWERTTKAFGKQHTNIRECMDVFAKQTQEWKVNNATLRLL